VAGELQRNGCSLDGPGGGASPDEIMMGEGLPEGPEPAANFEPGQPMVDVSRRSR
jgi:hypothetical protein